VQPVSLFHPSRRRAREVVERRHRRDVVRAPEAVRAGPVAVDPVGTAGIEDVQHLRLVWETYDRES